MTAAFASIDTDRPNAVVKKSHRYAALDAMRGLAAFAVVVYHLDRPHAPSAYVAVDFFFVLSGFVIARAYSKKILGGMSIFAFMKARYRRLYPLFLLGSIYGLGQVLLFWKADNSGFTDLLASISSTLLMLPSPSFFTRPINQLLPLYPLNGPAWSLFWELLVNLVYATALVRLKSKYLIVVALAALAMLLASVFHHRSFDLGWEWKSVDGGLARVLFSFTIGVLICRMEAHTKPRLTYLALLPIFFLCLLLLLPTQSPKFALLFCVLFSPLIVVAGSRLEVPQKLQPVCIFLGYLSYPIYMCHRGFTEIYEHLGLQVVLSPHWYIGLYLLAISVVSLFSAQSVAFLWRGGGQIKSPLMANPRSAMLNSPPLPPSKKID
jgi:peptidoglycan/LPS O-acetylase OafA/YrhL